MSIDHDQRRGVSRRSFITDAVAVGAALPALARAGQGSHGAKRKSILAYVGTYSSPQGPEGSKGNGPGIYVYEVDPSSGALKNPKVFEDHTNPAWLAFDPSKKYLYAANEINDYQGQKSGAATAFSIDPSSGSLTKLNTVSSEGAGPAHLSVHPSGKYVFCANYAGGTFSVLPVEADGKLGKATDVQRDSGQLGPIHAQNAPAGSFAISGHDRPHGHMIESDPAGKFVVGADLALDRLHVWKFDAEKGKLIANSAGSASVPPGDGPRHFLFHPNGRWFYSLQEEGSTIILFDYDGSAGRLTARQTLSSLPPGLAGTNFTSEIRISPDAKFIYAANRLHDSIAFFSISPTGELKFVGETWTRGDYPRSFTIDPTGNFLYSCNQRSDAIATFRINRKTGDLVFTGQYTPVGTPAIIIFLT
jgi:6-phosphogluconolactonase (cycloisomerase 2 family)